MPFDPFMRALGSLALAFLFALPIGFERAAHGRAAGPRAYPLLSVCVCGLLLLAQEGVGGPWEQADVMFGVLGGTSIVASGAIIKSRKRATGVNTAVSLWLTGAIGAGLAFGVPLVSAALALTTGAVLWAPSLVMRLRRTS